MFLILAVTILSRSSSGEMKAELIPFWSYAVPSLRLEILYNILGFIPVGVLGAYLFKWRIIPITGLFSLFIELIQLVSCRGLFEFDDIIHNTIGAVIGFLLWMSVNKIISRKYDKTS